MKNILSKKSGKRYFVYVLISFSFLIIGMRFLMLGYNEVVQSTDSSNEDIGFGYSVARIISILLSVVTGIIMSAVQLFNELIKRRKENT